VSSTRPPDPAYLRWCALAAAVLAVSWIGLLVLADERSIADWVMPVCWSGTLVIALVRGRRQRRVDEAWRRHDPDAG
jgi:uncharacterized membrane protein